MKTLLNTTKLHISLQRLAHQLVENHNHFEDTVLIGLQPRGVFFSDRICKLLKDILPHVNIAYGKLDNTFYRDDLDKIGAQLIPEATDLNFDIENKNVILIDDVLHTGRSVRAAMDALLDFGRPKNVELMCLINRRFTRELPIQADYVGLHVDTLFEQKVKVKWFENEGVDEVVLI